MKKIIMLSVLTLFIIYTIVSLFVEIPKVFNNIFYAIVTVFAVYFAIFYSDIGRGIKEKFQENNNKINAQNSDKTN